MYNLEINDPTRLRVNSKKFAFDYAIDGSRENPIEATYAALAGCAGVYALKACKKMNLSPMGIKITGKPYMDRANPLMLSKWVTHISFPDGWSEENKQIIIGEIQKCAVKEMISKGFEIDFVTEELLLENLTGSGEALDAGRVTATY